MEQKIAVFGSEKVLFGFTVAGFSNEEHFFHAFEGDIDEQELQGAFKKILARQDVGIVFVTEDLYETLQDEVLEHKRLLPSILRIPTWK